MSHNSTDDPTQGIFLSTLSEQAPAFEALVELNTMFGHLPAAYIKIHTTRLGGIGVQLDDPAKFEQWRVALQIPSASVNVKHGESHCWLTADTTFRGMPLDVTGFGVPLTAEQAQPQLITRYRDSNGTEWVHTGEWTEGDWPLYVEAHVTGPVEGLTVGEIEHGIGNLTPVGGAA